MIIRPKERPKFFPEPWALFSFDADPSGYLLDRTQRIPALSLMANGGFPDRVTGAIEAGLAGRFSRVGQTDANALMGYYGSLSTVDWASIIAGEWTLGFWIRRETVTVGPSTTTGYVFQIVSVEASGVATLAFRVQFDHSSGHFSVPCQNRIGTTQINAAADAFNIGLGIGTWAHIILRKTLASPTSIPTIEMWLNGNYRVPDSKNTTVANPNPGDWPTPVGARIGVGQGWRSLSGADNHSNSIDASVDDLVIYDKALTEEQIQTLYRRTLVSTL